MGLTAAAQTEQSDIVSATLQHGDETTVYYGQNSLVRAYNDAAEAGDVIRLSAGFFDGVTIRKQVSVYGVGFEGDPDVGLAKTRTSAINVQQDGEKTNGCYFEGLRIEGNLEIHYGLTKDINVVKCQVTGWLHLNTDTENITIRDCVLGYLKGRSYYSNSGWNNCLAKNLQVYNCFIQGGINWFQTDENVPSTVYIDHCVFASNNGAYVITNSVINDTNGVAVGSTVKGCVLRYTLNETVYTAEGNFYNRAMSTVFTDGIDNISYENEGTPRDLVVADDLVGIDGTPIGVHGGSYPFNKIANVPRILSFEATPSEDGKKVTLNLKADVPVLK